MGVSQLEEVAGIALLERRTIKGASTQVTPSDPKVREQRHRVKFGESVNRHTSLCSTHFVSL